VTVVVKVAADVALVVWTGLLIGRKGGEGEGSGRRTTR
jgi:hypothetical protein